MNDSKHPMGFISRFGELQRQRREFLNGPGRIYCSINGEGYGHSSRAIALASQFSKSEFLVGAYGYALERVQAFGIPAVEIAQELRFVGDGGSFDVRRTILKNPGAPLQMNQTVQEELELIKAHQVSLVVADGRIAPVLAAEKLGIPCLVLTNQSAFYPFFSRDSTLVKLFGRSFEWVMRYWLSSAEEILIPDFPPPYTVCLPNLSTDYQVKKRTRFVGPLVPWQAADIPAQPRPDGTQPWIVLSLGGHAYRQPLLDAVVQVARHQPDWQFCALTSLGGDADLYPPNIQRLPNMSNGLGYFKAADVVITQAGHSTAMELLTLGQPSIVVPDTNQIEQENNAARLAGLGVAKVLTYERLNPERLERAIERLLRRTDGLHDHAAQLAEQAYTLNGAAAAAQVLREFSQRLTRY